MAPREFLAGHRLAAGELVTTPHDRAGARCRLDILSAVGRDSDLPDALATARTTLGDERDRALAADIAIGVQRWRAALDHLIISFSKRPIQRLDREVVDVLRLSAYQLLHLTRVPAAAVVDDAVNLTGRVGKRSAAGLVNAGTADHRPKPARVAPAAPAERGRGWSARDRLPERHPFAPRVAGVPLAAPLWFRGDRAVVPVRQHPGSTDVASQPPSQYSGRLDRATQLAAGRRQPGTIRARCADRRGRSAARRRGTGRRLVRRAG